MAIEHTKNRETQFGKRLNFERVSKPDDRVEKEYPIEQIPAKEGQRHAPDKPDDTVTSSQSAATISLAAQEQQAKMQEIEDILAEGLSDIYLNMKPDIKQKFKKAGEEATAKIANLLNQTRTQFDKILKIIKNWLKLIPGVNRFFLEQEAKIKTDKIMALKK